MQLTQRVRRTSLMAMALTVALLAPQAALAQPAPDPGGDGRPAIVTPGDQTDPALPEAPADVPSEQRDELLGDDWPTSPDRAWTTVGDDRGLHVLVAEGREGYAWRTVASLSEPGFEADRWIGNACVTGSGDRLVVVYAPRTFTNQAQLFERGGFTAVVELSTGVVTKLPVQTSLAYYNPGCGSGETAVLTQGGVEDIGKTRLLEVDASTGSLGAPVEVPGQLTSAVPVGDAIVAADAGRLVEVAPDGTRTALALTSGVPFELHPDGAGGVVFLEREGERAQVRRAAPGPDGEATVTTLASGPLDRLGLTADAEGHVVITGEARLASPLPTAVQRLDVPKDSAVSTTGVVALTAVQTEAPTADGDPAVVGLTAEVPATGADLAFTVEVLGAPEVAEALSPALSEAEPGPPGEAASAGEGSSTDPVDSDRTCSVPRNDPLTQVYQPKPRQVEWAVDQAVTDSLYVQRAADWKQSGLPAYTPQGMFPPRTLQGGGRVPAQIMLGILAQESNLGQASYHALPGVTGNPLIGNFYGRQRRGDSRGDAWAIRWDKADCGYGVAQVTDGMRLGGDRLPTHQRAIAVDFAANIAAGLQILQDKWNQTRAAGMTVNDGNSRYIENWFFAIWAYNSGFYPDSGNGSPWGVGWLNNPVNPNYPAHRLPFLDGHPEHAAHPQHWPYPEKVIGFAAHSFTLIESPGVRVAAFRPAWWTTIENRANAKPPVTLFCDATNDCEPGATHQPTDPDVANEPAGPCAHIDADGEYDLRCWYHEPVTWKANCATAATCGNELLRFDPGYAYQADGASYPPNCSLDGLPAGALVIDDVVDSVPSVRPDCERPWTNQGTFRLDFQEDGTGQYRSKIDFHQIGGGFGGHFWFAHTRTSEESNDRKLDVTGTWTLDRRMAGWARVLVHMPDHGAHTQQARYEIDLGNGDTQTRTLLQRTLQHRWVSLGAFRFDGTPSVSLSNVTLDGDGTEDVAWDAVAIQPLPGKPRHQIVALGDSYASGEGGSSTDGAAYYPETNNNGGNAYRNGCHRSPHSWSRQGRLADSATSIGDRADAWNTDVDYHLLACSGAQTENILPTGITNQFGDPSSPQYRDLTQLDRGFLDEHTTLVTLSVGGNDAQFGPIIQECIALAGPIECFNAQLPNDDLTLAERAARDVPGPVKASVMQTLEWIHREAPNAKVVLMGYPMLLEPGCILGCVPGLSGPEISWLNDMSRFLNAHLEGAAEEVAATGVDVMFADPVDDFLGYGIGAADEAIYGLVFTKTAGDTPGPSPSQQSFHPNIAGAGLYANALDRALRRLGL